jgi:hypothetical protein
MGRRLPIKVINQIKLCLDLAENIPNIAAALKILKITVYKLQLNWDLWGQLYTPPSVKLGRPSALLEYQKLVSSLGIVLRFTVLTFLPDRDYSNSSTTGLLPTLTKYKTSFSTN